MKIDLSVLNTNKTESTNATKKMRLSENASTMVFQLFTKNVYSNPIGTIVREITSNCFDSHVEANINSPVIIKKSFDNETNIHYISFIDFGVGMSPERIENIYMVYFESTKRTDNTQIGGFGIGGKTPLAYKRSTGQGEAEYDNSFFVITNYNGTKYYYCIFEGANSPEVSLIHSEPTTEHNGTEVRIPVLPKDIPTFTKEMVRQLYYFENIIFEGFENNNSYENILLNKYQIVRGKNFLFRGKEYSTNVHVCLGRVAYPIDYNAININSYDYIYPVALRFEVGEINVTASRESLDYSEKTIKLIKKKLEDTKKELAELLAKQYENVQTLEDYFQLKNGFGVLKFSNGNSFVISDKFKPEDLNYVNFKYNSLSKIPNDDDLFDLFFNMKMYGKKVPRHSRYDGETFRGTYGDLDKVKNLYYIDGEFKRKIIKQAWLKTKHIRFYLIEKINLLNIPKWKFNDYFKIEVFESDGITFSPKFKLIQEMQEEYFDLIKNHATDYETIDVPEEFKEERKAEKLTEEVLKSTIPVRIFGGKYRGSIYRIKVNHLTRFNGSIVYCTKEHEHTLKNACHLFKELFKDIEVAHYYYDYNYKNIHETFGLNKKSGILFIMLAENNVKYMNYCKKAFHVKDIYNKLFYRKADFVQKFFNGIDIINKYDELKQFYTSDLFKLISPKWRMKINRLNSFIKTLPANDRNDLSNIKSELEKYFNINIKETPETIDCGEIIDELKDVEVKNAKILEYIDFPYRYEYGNVQKEHPELIRILKLVMVL